MTTTIAMEDDGASSSSSLMALLESQRVAGIRNRAREASLAPGRQQQAQGQGVTMGAGGLAEVWYVTRRNLRRAQNAVGMVTSAVRTMLRLSDTDVAAVTAQADAVISANLLLSPDQKDLVVQHFDYFFNRMCLRELSMGGDGVLNMDPATLQPIDRGAALAATEPTLSVEYLEFLRAQKNYVPIHGDAFLSLKGFIDLARCPVLFSIDVDAAAMLISSLIRLDTDGDDTELAEWRTRGNMLDGFQAAYKVVPVLIFDRYEMLRAALARFRCCFVLSNERPQPTMRPAPNRQKLLEYFDMELVPWLDKLYESLNMEALRAYPSPDAWKAAMIENMLPAKSVRDLIVENAKLTVAKGEVDHQYRAQQLDLYYANLVHGASVRAPLQEIWCPHNETEHSERDSEQFFRLMWTSLKDVLDESIASLPVGSSAADAINRFVASIRNVKEAKKIMKEVGVLLTCAFPASSLFFCSLLPVRHHVPFGAGVGEEPVVPHLGPGAHDRGGAAAAPPSRRRLPVGGRFRKDLPPRGMLLPAPPRGVSLRVCGGRGQALLLGAAERPAKGQHHRPPALRAVGRDRVPHALHGGERGQVQAAARDGGGLG